MDDATQRTGASMASVQPNRVLRAELLTALAECLTRHGERFHGGHVAQYAEEWLGTGLTAEGADAWMTAGVWSAVVAYQLSAYHGIKPAQLASVSSDLVYACCNGDASVRALLVALGEDPPRD